MSVDPMADKMPNWSAYNYVMHNPVRLIDLNGMAPEGPGDGFYKINKDGRYVLFGIKHPFAAVRIGFGVTKGATNISTNSTRFATRGEVLNGSKSTDEDRSSENGAFRHTLWQASITSEFGASISKEAGDTHEDNSGVDLGIRSFKSLDAADQTADLLNNEIGRKIGMSNEGSSMDIMANIVLDEFKNNGLYTATLDKEGNWKVSKTKLSSSQHKQLKKIFKGLNKDGRNTVEQNKIDTDAKKRAQSYGPKW